MAAIAILVTIFLGVSGEEFTARSSIRFPTEDFENVHSSIGMYQSETKLSPLLLQSNNGKQHYILPQVSDSSSPFGDPNAKGFSQGFILQHYPSPVKSESEFHHTMPPPLRATTYGPPRPLSSYGSRQKTPHTYNRHYERHRFGSQRFPHQHSSQYPTSMKVMISSKPKLKETKSQLSDAIYKYSTFNQQKTQVNLKKNREPEYGEIYTQHDFIQKEHEIPIVKGSSDFHYKGKLASDYPEEFSSSQDTKYYKSQNKFPKAYYEVHEEDYSTKYQKEDQSHTPKLVDPMYYPNYMDLKEIHNLEHSPQKNKYHYRKHEGEKYIPVKQQTSEYFNSDLPKTSYEHLFDDNNSNYFSSKYNAGVNKPNYEEPLIGDYYESGNNNAPKFSHHAAAPDSLRQYGITPVEKSGSEWTPINAPEGAVPARSYEIQAPDLSQAYYSHRSFFNSQIDNERIQERPIQRIPSNYHKNANSEEVVSAVVMVKQ